jgi:O-antigen biosynthesis protein
MCNLWCFEMVDGLLAQMPSNAQVLEVGSRNVNGSVRKILEPKSLNYVGVDLFEGNGVDIVLDVARLRDHFGDDKFDVVVSTEMLEHCSNWQEALYQMSSVLRQGGLLIITTRSPGFELHDYPADYWRFSRADFAEIFGPIGEILLLRNDMTLDWPCGVGIAVRKLADQATLIKWHENIMRRTVYSMATQRSGNGGLVESSKPMIFDQYSRYKACSDLLRQAGITAGSTILDIGSGPECLFGRFLPDMAASFVDPLIPPESGAQRITGNVYVEELTGKTYDCVTAVDVLEHVPLEHRRPFIERVSSLGRNILVLGFPTSDSSDGYETDQAIDEEYRKVAGLGYSWLREHYENGLPTLSTTVEQLQSLGWHCQAVGHGHTPWLRELLAFVICILDHPNLEDLVLEVSERFNKEFYSYDFRPPYYRQFVIASRIPIAPIIPPMPEDGGLAEGRFRTMMDEVRKRYFVESLRLLSTVEAQRADRDKKIAERDRQIAERDRQIAERDKQITRQNRQIAERDEQIRLIVNSRSWKLTRVLRLTSRLLRDGLTNNDRQRMTQIMMDYYHRVPLPAPAKRFASFVYHGFRRKVFQPNRFCFPTTKPVARQKHLPDYIVWGVIPWHFRHQRPQQLSMELARTRRRVFYVSPNLIDDDRAGFQIDALDSVGLLFQIKLFAKGAPQIYSNAPTSPLVSQLRASMGEVLEWADCGRIVSLVQHPFWCDVASVLPNRDLVYDCMDNHEGFGGMSEDLVQLEKRLFSDSDLTITTSAWLDQSVAKYARYRALIRNATDYELFSQVPESPYRDPQGRRIIGYYGAIAEWLDLDLVVVLAQQHPECSVVMIGADTVNAKHRFEKLPNVTFMGEVPYRKLPHYLHSFDVCLLPFKVGPLTLATNPVKVYEYLSAGKAVVATDLPEMAQFDGLIYVAAKQRQFVETISLILTAPESRDLIQRRKNFAQGQTWRHRTEALTQQAEVTNREARASVIVVTYNNIELTRACLESIDEHSQYDNLEVIVIDNASCDGSRGFLERWASVDSNRKLILNDNNRGFAAANNQGLNIATGDFLVMLNNDTYVTPGWVRTLVNHLKRDNTIGLIGPVTNNIGNEAKIDITYADMNEMVVKSAGYTRRHVGQLYPLRTAAFFCAMMKRETFARVGSLDEAFGRGWFEDDDYCRRVAQVGLRIVCAEDVFVHHHLSASFNKLAQQDRQQLFEENKKTYEAKWGVWIPHGYRQYRQPAMSDRVVPEMYAHWRYISGNCIVCGKLARFFYKDETLWRESLNCEHCRTTGRYRSIARGILRAISELTGSESLSLATLPRAGTRKLHVYDTQPPFSWDGCAYPLPDLLKATGWIEVELSQYKPNKPLGIVLAKGVTNQNLECLTFPDESLDLVITSDVMEHVRLDDLAHREIYRVLKPSGIYIFTVPHDRSLEQTMIRVQINDPNDPKKDVHLLEPEYHGDTNSDGGLGALSYRAYGRDLESYLTRLGFEVDYTRKDISNFGILNTELYYCRKNPDRTKVSPESG